VKKRKARAVRDASALTPHIVRKVTLSLFRRRNDYGDFDTSAVVRELAKFGVTNAKQFRLLMKKHRRSILAEEKRKMSRAETLHLLGEFHPAGIDVHANTSWFAVTGLVREAMGREFGWDEIYSEADSPEWEGVREDLP